jgi:hypothetical protein
MMDEREFWEVIEGLDAAGGDPDAIVRPAVERLALESEQNIREFQDMLAEKLFRLDGEAWAERIGEKAFDGNRNTFDRGHFLHARCCVIANGREFYNDVRRNPSHMPKDQTFAALLEIGPRAFEMKTGQPLNHRTVFSPATFGNNRAWDKTLRLGCLFPGFFLGPLAMPYLGGVCLSTAAMARFAPWIIMKPERTAFGFGIVGLVITIVSVAGVLWLRRSDGRLIFGSFAWRLAFVTAFLLGSVMPWLLLATPPSQG